MHGYHEEGSKYKWRKSSFDKDGPHEKRDDMLKPPKVNKKKPNAPAKNGRPYWPTKAEGLADGDTLSVEYLDARVAAQSLTP